MTVSNELKEAVGADVSFFKVAEDRRSVRKYDTSAAITEEEIRELLTIATKAPSSSNMQPWRFLVITDQETKNQLLPIANNQQQVVEASAIVLVMADLEMYKLSEQIYTSAAEAGYMSEDIKNNMIANSTRLYSSLPAERLKEIVMFDCGLVSMQLMLAAKAKGYDTVPMGGYNRDKAREFFQIPDRYLPALMLPIGKAASPGHPTTRLPLDQIVFFNEMK
ncbi:nitroreductase family protein [Paenibacillus nanensis]|uniref:Nitroreductase family protein n=1 Tax=Paenibacillus nanensis TaxID=393251 RepID=A0A3A1UX30_9BACL|nr:nitroreductase family protein [Paenibacillus nanensis]RIX53078.1 nitroreductase family protein [Paenibacillus nanensis]